MLRRCRCGAQFDGEHWQRLCWPCWRRERGRSEPADAYQRGYQLGYRDGCAAVQCAGLTDDLIASAIQLAHPDRHPPERAALANAVTAQLLALRGDHRAIEGWRR
jgi:hypothetical protein